MYSELELTALFALNRTGLAILSCFVTLILGMFMLYIFFADVYRTQFDCTRFPPSSAHMIIRSVRITRNGLQLIHRVTGPFIPSPTHDEDADTTLVDIQVGELIDSENKENIDPTAMNKDGEKSV
jgi:hypothetical protein